MTVSESARCAVWLGWSEGIEEDFLLSCCGTEGEFHGRAARDWF